METINKSNPIDWDTAFSELQEIYEAIALETQQEQFLCHQCGECCNFWHNGMKLYIYHIEREYIRHKHANMLKLQNGCCGAQKENLCHIHSIRPLGCRTQFCSVTLQEMYEKYSQKIRALEKKYGISYNYSEAFEEEIGEKQH